MKRSEELRIQKAEKVKRMEAINAAAEKDNKRSLTEAEQTEWDQLDGEVRQLTTDIARAERIEEFGSHARSSKSNRQDTATDDDDDDASAHQRGATVQIKRKAAPYSVGKAIREFARGGEEKLTGIEKESHTELSRGIVSEGLLVPFNQHRRDQNTTSNADSIDVAIDPRLSILGQEPLYTQMGLTIVPGLTGTLKIGKKTPVTAGKYAEKAPITATGNQPTFELMSPERYGITDIFTKELLAQENPAVHAAIVADMIKGCDRKITADAYAAGLTAAADNEVAAGAKTDSGLLAIMSAVPVGGSFAMNRATFFELMGVKVDEGSGKFLADMVGEDNGIGKTHRGTRAIYSDLFDDGEAKQYLTYGQWSELWLGFWGALEILMNPYTYQKNGQVEMTVNRLADIVCRNEAAFARSADLDELT